jgi:uncharacterized membrane protein YphA (DoxX/SURF4 family)
MKILINIARIIVGILFLFSGLIKANDPLGLSYKMQEFFEVWGWHGLNDYTLSLSVLMIAFEIIAGVAVLVGWRMKLFSWLLLLLIIFFTFLTAYALFSGKIRTCGCFGDCIPLTAQTSFIKDITLLVLILFLFANRNKLSSSLSSFSSVIILILTTIFSFGIQWYVLKHLPVLDCLPYKKGNNITEKMKVPAGAIPDSTVISFVYNKQGKKVEFTADKFPEDFDDTVYQFVKRYDKVVRKGNAEAAIKDFALQTATGTDTTQAMLNDPAYQIWIFTQGLDNDPVWKNNFSVLHALLKQKNIPVSFITSNYDNVAAWLNKTGIYKEVSLLKCDFVAIKTAARANPTLYLVKQGTIMGKWSWSDLQKAIKAIES